MGVPCSKNIFPFGSGWYRLGIKKELPERTTLFVELGGFEPPTP